MGGLAVNGVRRLNQNEMVPTYEWVEHNILSVIHVSPNNAIPIGSFGKKPLNETSGDIDVAIDVNLFVKEGLKFEEVSPAINILLKESGFETTLLKGFDQVSVKVPICGDTNKGFAQVDLMPSLDLKWARFMYHSPNLREGESRYNGAVRNALLMALVSEPSKENTKLFEGKVSEYKSLAVRFPTGVWNIKRSFLGKSGKIVKQGTVLEAEFITREPQDVIDLAIGYGFKVDTANSFETLWEVIHKKDFVYKNTLNEIMSKFKVNLKSMRQEVPEEAIKRYKFLNEDVKDFLKPKLTEDIIKDAKDRLLTIDDWNEINKFADKGIIYLLPEENVHDALIRIIKKHHWWRGGIEMFFREEAWLKNFLSKDEINELILNHKIKNETDPIFKGAKTLKEFNKLKKEKLDREKKEKATNFLKIIFGDIKHQSLDKVLKERAKRNQFTLVYLCLLLFEKHKGSYHTIPWIEKTFATIYGKDIERADFSVGSQGEQWGYEFLNILDSKEILKHYKVGNKQYYKFNPSFKDDPQFVSDNFQKTLKYLIDLVSKHHITEFNKLTEELLGYVKTSQGSEDMVGIHKNPINIDNFAPNVKAIITIDGDMFIEDYPEIWLHKDMAKKLKSIGQIFYFGSFYDNPFVTMMRIENTNAFGLTEGTERTIDTIKTIEKAQKKNPNLRLFAKRYEETEY